MEDQFSPSDSGDTDGSDIPLAAWVVGGAAALTAAHPRAGQALRRAGGGLLPAGGSERGQLGTMRLVLINDASSPDTYVFDIEVPPSGRTVVNPDGSATVYDKSGKAISHIARPWAYDSIGRPQRTWYTVDADGNLVQHVEAAPDALFPILADPNETPGAGAAATAVNVLPIDGGQGSGNQSGEGGGTATDPPPYEPPQFEPVPEAPPAQTLDNDPGPSGGGSGEHGGSVPGPGKPPEPVEGNDIDPGFDNVDLPFAGDPFFQLGLRPNLDPSFNSVGQPSAGAAQIGMVDEDGNIWRPGIFNEPGIKGPGFYTTIDGVRVVLIPLPDGGYQIWQNNHLWVYNADGTLRDYMGQVPDPGFVYEKPLGPDVLSAASVFSSLPPGVKAAIASAAQSIGKPALPDTPGEPTGVTPPDESRSLPGLPPDAPEPLGRGSTGRQTPQNLVEQVAMEQVRSNPQDGRPISVPMTDPRWPPSEGWAKYAQNVAGVEIHYVMNATTGQVDDFKFK